MTRNPFPELDFEPTTHALLARAVARFGSNDFIVEPDRRLTYAQADAYSRIFAKRLLHEGVGKGTRVAAKYSNTVEWIIAWLAVTRVGGFFMPLSSAYTLGETRKCLLIGDAEFYLSPLTIVGKNQHAEVAAMLGRPEETLASLILDEELPYLRRVLFTSFGPDVSGDAIDLCDPASAPATISDRMLAAVEAQVKPADWMLAIFTSGSTSDPKCVIHTHGATIRHATAIADLNEWDDHDRIFAGMPFFWVGGNCYTVFPVMLVGATILCMERFEAGAALDLMEREGATHAIGWPGVINPLLSHPTLPDRTIPAFANERWDPARWAMTGLGMSESGANHTALYVEDRQVPAAIGSVGRAIPHVEHRIVDEETGEPVADGEIGFIHLRGYSLMAGYYKREREQVFEPDGFFNTQDRGFLRDGFLHYVGRDVGLIKTAGNNVSAAEVEGVLKARADIANAVVVGLPDAAIGQRVGAAIVPAGEAIDMEVLKVELRRDLSNYKIPTVIRQLAASEIPFMANGKLDYRLLVKLIEGEA